MTGIVRIDAHVHFLVYDPREHVWVTDELGALKGSFLPGDLEPLLTRAGFDGCIAVEARQFPHENEWLLDLARAHPSISGIVGWVDLCAPDVTACLEALTAHPRIKGRGGFPSSDSSSTTSAYPTSGRASWSHGRPG